MIDASTDMARPVGAVLAVVVLALAARLTAAVMLGDRLHFDDEAVYVDAATNLTAGVGLGPEYRSVPGYPMVVAALAQVTPGGVLGIRIGQAVVTALGAALVFALAAVLLDRRAAFVAGLLYALDPLLVAAGGLLYPETVAAVLLVTVTLGAVLAARGDAPLRALVLGGALGLLAQLRPVTLVVAPVVALWIGATLTARPSRRVLHVALVGLGCALALAPWTYRNYRLRGALGPIAAAGTNNAPVSREAVEASGLAGALLRRAVDDPMALGTHVGREFLHFWELYPQRLTTDNDRRRAELHARDARLPVSPSFPAALRDGVSLIVSSAEFVLAVLGMGVLWRRRPTAAVLLVSTLLAVATGYALFIGKMRYRITVVPLLLVLAAAGLTRLPGLAPRGGATARRR